MKTYKFTNRFTKEVRLVGGLKDLAQAWNIAEAYTSALGWHRMDLVISEVR